MLTSMKSNLNAFLNQTSDDVISNLNSEQSISYVQDSFHLATKLRNRMLKSSILLPMGSRQVSVAHLKMLIKLVPKAVHGVVANDISPFDRQNVGSFQKVSDNRVLFALEKHIPDSEATVLFLKLSRMAIEAFTDVNLTPLERIQYIWRSLYFFRIWRKWLKTYICEDTKRYDTEENFISTNAFQCLELNAYGLLHLMKKFRDAKESHLFLPTLFNSQGCEGTFRQFRSMSTANWTKINFSLCELLHMIGRIEMMNDIAYFKLANLASLPRLQKQSNEQKEFELPTDEEIRNALKIAFEIAQTDAVKLNMHVNPDDVRFCELKKGNITGRKNPNECLQDIPDEDSTDEVTMDCTHVRDYSERVKDFDGNSPFVQVLDEDGTTKLIKKSAIVWDASQPKEKLSNDRLKRVQARRETEKNGPKRKSAEQNISGVKKVKTQNSFFKLDEIEIGEWCVFSKKIDASHNHSENGIHNSFVIGSVLGFKYIAGKTERDKQYSLDIAPVSHDGPNKRGLEVLALWYDLNNDFTLKPMRSPSFFNDMDNYLGCVKPPNITENPITGEKTFQINGDVFELKTELATLLPKTHTSSI